MGTDEAREPIPFPVRAHRTPMAGGITWALLATAFWSSSALVVERLTGSYHLSPLHISLWRVLLVLPVVLIALLVRRPSRVALSWEHLPLQLTCGVVGVTLSYMAWATSVKLNSAPVAAALGFSAPVFVALGDRLFFGTRLYLTQIGAIAVNLLGCALVAGLHSPSDVWRRPEGLAVGIGVGMTFAGYTLLGRASVRSQRLDPLANLLYLFAFGGLGLLIWSVATEGSHAFSMNLPVDGWILIVSLAIGPTLLAYALYNASLKSLPATMASLCTSFEPVLVAIGATVFFGHDLSMRTILGIALVVGAVATMQIDAVLRAGKSEKSLTLAADAVEVRATAD